jgi:hypothetical protein
MFFLLLGMAAGVALGLGQLTFVAGPAEALTNGLIATGATWVGDIVQRFAGDENAVAAQVVQAVIVALMPGIIAVLLMRCARSGPAIRKLGALAAVIGAVGIVATQPAPASFAAAVALLAVGAALAFWVGSAVSAVAAALSALLATTQIRLLMSDEANIFTETAEELAGVAGLGSPGLWKLVLVVASAALPAIAFWYAVQD